MNKLQVTNFGQIQDATIRFGDLTVLVGPQGTGKSLLLQWLKMALDASEVVTALREGGYDVDDAESLLDLVFGEGMSSAWRPGETRVVLDRREIRPEAWTKVQRQAAPARVFFIPAHRALLLSEGWPSPFLRLNADTPVVARLFSQNLYHRFSARGAEDLFPVDRLLKKEYRDLIDAAVFHGGRVELRKEGLRRRLGLSYGSSVALPFMTWTAGQREFTPLLLGLYHVMPPRKIARVADVEVVVVEEPEMGLHPQAITTFMVLVLDLLWRGYKVVLSTHSPLVLDAVWALRIFSRTEAPMPLVCEAFGLQPSAAIREVMRHALRASYTVHHLGFSSDSKRVVSTDISELDPLSDNTIQAGWGGLTSFSSQLGAAVSTAVNLHEARV